MINDSKYFKILNNPKNKKLRLFCFPYAGGTASIYNSFIDKVNDEIELVAIQLPGRAKMMFDKPIDNMEELVNILYQLIVSDLQEPFAFFGHSMGGSIAFALTQKIEQLSSKKPKFIIISATRPQHIQNKNSKYKLNDADLTNVLRANSASPKEVLDSKEMMELILPGVRADYKLIETYTIKDRPSLLSKLIIFNCEDDIKKDEICMWQKHFKNDLKYITFTGGHFFINSDLNNLVKELNTIQSL